MVIFLDTSAWVKYFLNEEGTLRIQHFILQYPPDEENIFATSAVTYAEMIATLTRAYRGQRISEEDFEAMITTFQEQWEKVDVVEVNTDLIERSGQLARKHALRGCEGEFGRSPNLSLAVPLNPSKPKGLDSMSNLRV